LLAVEIRVNAVDRRAVMKTTDVDHLGINVEGRNVPDELYPRSSGPRTRWLGVGRGLAAVLGGWSTDEAVARSPEDGLMGGGFVMSHMQSHKLGCYVVLRLLLL
jgi:hypothetical protein